MPASAADVAKYTNDGIVVSTGKAAGDAIKALYPNARDNGDGEIEMFFVNAADAQALIDERWPLVSVADPVHVGIEVEESLGLGTTIPLVPTVPCFTAIDEENAVNATVRTRAYASELGTDRQSVEVRE